MHKDSPQPHNIKLVELKTRKITKLVWYFFIFLQFPRIFQSSLKKIKTKRSFYRKDPGKDCNQVLGRIGERGREWPARFWWGRSPAVSAKGPGSKSGSRRNSRYWWRSWRWPMGWSSAIGQSTAAGHSTAMGFQQGNGENER